MEQPGDDDSDLQSSLNNNPEIYMYMEPEKEKGQRRPRVPPEIKPKPKLSKDTQLFPKPWITAENSVSSITRTLEPEANLQSTRFAAQKVTISVSPEFRHDADAAISASARRISGSNSITNPNAFSMPRSGNEEYVGSDGYIRVYKGDHRVPQGRHTFDDMSSEDSDENVEIDTKIAPGVRHLHIHINLKFMKDDGRIRRRNSKNKKGKKEQNQTYTEQRVHFQSRSESVTNSFGPPPFNLNAPPVPPKTYKVVSKGPEVDKDGYLLRENQDKSEYSDETTEYEPYEESVASSMVYARKGHRDYDEISFKDMLPDFCSSNVSEEIKTSNAKDDEKSEEGREPQSAGYPWLFHHTQKRKAEERIKTDKIGSFAVIEEDIEETPFTPYTLLVVSSDRLKKVPVTKHILKQGKARYTLANEVRLKLASIQDLVAYYQTHDLPVLKHKLRPLD